MRTTSLLKVGVVCALLNVLAGKSSEKGLVAAVSPQRLKVRNAARANKTRAKHERLAIRFIIFRCFSDVQLKLVLTDFPRLRRLVNCMSRQASPQANVGRRFTGCSK